MNLKITASILAAFHHHLVVEGRLLQGNHGGPGGHGGSGGHGGQGGHGGGRGGGRDRPFDGPNGGGRPGFPGWEDGMVQHIDLMCGDEFDCQHRGGGDGKFTCRTRYHPITNESRYRSMCLPSNMTKTGDDCGCCGGDCPELPEFETLDCDPFVPTGGGNGLPPNIANRFPDVDVALVCRDLINPFTGEEVEATIPVPVTMGLEGDVCGCCEAVSACPPPPGERQVFQRPDRVNKTCDAVDEEFVPCNVTRRVGNGGNGGMGGGQSMSRSSGGFQTIEGIFVCRQLFNPWTGTNASEALCIPPDRAWETDECGCCGEECPERPAPIAIDCNETCEIGNGRQGAFVCRSLFHPVTGDEIDHTMCIPSHMSWVTDQCGCCGNDCPGEPVGGFGDEDTQLLTLALETEEFPSVLTDGSAGDSAAIGRTACGVAAIVVSATLFLAFFAAN